MKNWLLDVKARIEFWYAKRNIYHGEAYELHLDVNNPAAYSIKILKKYPGTIVEFSDLYLRDNQLEFNMTVIANPNGFNVEKESFRRYVNYIMMSLLSEAVDNMKRVENEDREADPSELDAERAISEESDSVPETRVSKRKPRKKAVRRNKGVRSKV